MQIMKRKESDPKTSKIISWICIDIDGFIILQ